MQNVHAILEKKNGIPVACISADATVVDAARMMNTRRIGSVVVTSGEKVVGIFTERDILNRVVAENRVPIETTVREVMTSPVACCREDTSLAECRRVMRTQRIRHLPVVENDRLIGMVSIGDVLQTEVAEQTETIRHLHEYLYGEGAR